MNGDNRNFNALRPVKQYFEWGTVKWLDEPEDTDQGRLLVGHVTFLPHKRQDEHLHTGDEQILYIISGNGEHWVDGRCYPLLPGMVYHISPYARHELRNAGDQPLEMIIVYNPSSSNHSRILPSPEFTREYIENYKVQNLRDIIDIAALQKIQDKFSDASSLAIVIRDKEGNALTEVSNLPDFCSMRCRQYKGCKFKSRIVSADREEPVVIRCCYESISVHAPIYFGDQYIGNILCGPVFLNEPSREAIEAVRTEGRKYGNPDMVEAYMGIRKITRARLYAIIELLKTINRYIVETGINTLGHRELHAKTLRILEEVQARNQLEKSLAEARMKAVQAQMSPHFLFNTLSIIGELAYMKGAREAAETTFALSNLLRKSLKKSQELVPVKEEIEYIEDYILIQQKRFRSFVKTDINVSEEIMDLRIPFMTLQILVENAIIHGLHPSERQGMLAIEGEREDGYMVLKVEDNGVGIPQSRLQDVIKGNLKISTSGAGLGLINLKERLSYYYGEDYELDINSRYGEGTTIRVTLPLKGKRGDFA